ncbi:MAG: hypothetical protein WAK11_13310 [Candidatus Cybelea sp.]
MSLLLSVITLNPAMAPASMTGFTQGYVQASPISPDSTCKPGAICAWKKNFTRNGCFFNNFWNNSTGGTPLAIDITETGPNGSPVYIYWVNNTSTNVLITGKASANFYCPRLR